MEDANAVQMGRPRLRPAVRKTDAWFLLLAASVVTLDQLTKWFVRLWLDRGDVWHGEWPVHLVHVLNTGAAFGTFQGNATLLAFTSIIGSAAILVYLFNPGFAHPVMRVGLALMFAGAVGNLIDRVVNGQVVDFIKFPNWPAFNVADSSISIGVALLIWTMLFLQPEPRPDTNS